MKERDDNGGGAKTLKPKCVLVGLTFFALVSVTPASGAPREIEDFCFKQSLKVQFHQRGEWEAFMANCIANLTPTPTKQRKYRNGLAR